MAVVTGDRGLQLGLLPPAVGRQPLVEHVPSHDVELIDPAGHCWSAGGVFLGFRFERGLGWAADVPLADWGDR